MSEPRTITRVTVVEVVDNAQLFQSELNARLNELTLQYEDREFGILNLQTHVVYVKRTDSDPFTGDQQIEEVRYVGVITYQFEEDN